MNPNDERHMPTPEFRARLETEIGRALRHEQRVTATRWTPNARLLSRLAAAILVGVVVGAAPAQVADARQRDSLLVAANAELRLATTRLAVAREEYERASQLYAAGVITEREIRAAERQLRELEMQLEKVQLNIAETRATSDPPRNDLTAPLVGGDDFVRQRMMLELRAKQQELLLAEKLLLEAEQRVRTGVEATTAQLSAEAEVLAARGEMELLAGKLRLREEFLAGRSQREAVEREAGVLELQQRLENHKRSVSVALRRLEVVRRQVETGVASRRDSLRAELEVAELRAEIELLEFQLARLRQGGR